jgi:hypothetical protein
LKRAQLSWLLSLLMFVIAGCGDKGSVSGLARYDGKPIGNGAITFMPVDGNGPTVGGRIADGRYLVEGLTPGKNTVQIVGVKKVNFAVSNADMERQARINAQHGDTTGIVERADEVPPDAPGNNSEVEVKSGEQTLDFDLKRKPGS